MCVWILLHFFWFNIIVNTFNRIIFKNIGFPASLYDLNMRLEYSIKNDTEKIFIKEWKKINWNQTKVKYSDLIDKYKKRTTEKES